jgi:N-acetyl-anhydromuramyl-L-alanine amidase AmpD
VTTYATSWPMVTARWFQPWTQPTPRPVRVLVVHVMDAPEKGSTAEDVAEYFRTTERKASAHVCVDNNSVVRCVRDDDIAYAAPGCNRDGIQMELAGYSAQSADGWMDEYSMATLQEGARTGALYVKKYALPIRRLSMAELLAGARGICGHDTVTAAYHQSDHTDPGPYFPWPEFLGMVKIAAGRAT